MHARLLCTTMGGGGGTGMRVEMGVDTDIISILRRETL